MEDKPEESSEPKQSLCIIERKFLSYKFHYFLLCGAHVGVIPYLPVLAKTNLGCSATTVGLLATCMQFSTTISKPLFGILADYFNKMKALLASLICIEVLLNLAMLSFPRVGPPPTSLDFPNSGPPESQDRPLLKIAHTRIYDASAAVHLVPRLKSDSNHKYLQNESPSSEDRNSSYRHDFLQQKVYSSSKKGDFGKDNVSLLNTNAKTKLKCYLECPRHVKATCRHFSQKCFKLQHVNSMKCVPHNRERISICEKFHTSRTFTIAYDIQTNSSNNSNEFDIFLKYINYSRTSNHNGHHICNVSRHCRLECQKDIAICQARGSSRRYSFLNFWLFATCALLSAMCQGSLFTISDTACYEGLRGTKANFGRQRFWGAIGWGSIAPLTGFLNDLASQESDHDDYSAGFYLMAVLSSFFLLNVLSMDFQKSPEAPEECVGLRKIFCTRPFVLMEISVFLAGILTAFTSNYVIWYLESMGSSRLLMGLSLAVECLLGEAPFMFFSEWLISKLGHWNIMTLTFIAFSMRFTGYYFMQNPWWVLPIELLNGFTYGLFYPTMTSYAKLISSNGNEATVQGIFGGTFQGLGTGIGSLIAGLAFDKYGGRMSFLMAAILSAISALINCIMQLFVRNYKSDLVQLP